MNFIQSLICKNLSSIVSNDETTHLHADIEQDVSRFAAIIFHKNKEMIVFKEVKTSTYDARGCPVWEHRQNFEFYGMILNVDDNEIDAFYNLARKIRALNLL